MVGNITVEDVNTNVVNLLKRYKQDLIQSKSTKASVTPISNTQENLTTFQQRENNLTEFSVEGLSEDEGEQTSASLSVLEPPPTQHERSNIHINMYV